MELASYLSWLIKDDIGYYSLFLVFWCSPWLLRRRDPTAKGDIYILTGLTAWIYRSNVNYLGNLLEKDGISSYASVLAALASVLCLWFASRSNGEGNVGQSPWILPSKTTHTRLFPKVHSFGYALLQVAIPVGSEGRFGSLISVGKVRRQGWYHVQATDYLERGSQDTDLKSKLRTYLQSQGLDDDDWSHAWLITAPRFLGYSFNPVSFWYIYTSQNILNAMILEVNNTFGERRMYLLRTKDNEEKSQDSQSDVAPPEKELPDPFAKFQNSWAKDFHVSPFSSRKGHYSLTAVDPFRVVDVNGPVFHNNITLKSSKNHVKLIARVFSAGKALNPDASGRLEMVKFILLWSWVGFMTFPRILKQAASLFWSKGLNFWFRPEVMPTSISRSADAVELELSPFFEAYLKALIAKYSRPIRVQYTSNTSGSLPLIFTNVATDLSPEPHENAEELQIRVLTPVFFGRFMHYAHASEAFDRECIFTDEKNRTVWLSRPDTLSGLIKTNLIGTTVRGGNNSLSWVETLRWNIHRLLRCPPANPAYSFTKPHGGIRDIRMMPFSPMDRFVMTRQSDEALRYRRLCARLFLAQRFALGFVPVIDLADILIRVALLWRTVCLFKAGSLNVLPLAMVVHLYAFAKGT